MCNSNKNFILLSKTLKSNFNSTDYLIFDLINLYLFLSTIKKKLYIIKKHSNLTISRLQNNFKYFYNYLYIVIPKSPIFRCFKT